MTIRTVVVIIGTWFFLSWLVWILDYFHMYWYGKKRGIPINKLQSFFPVPINQAYRAWGEANGVDVTRRLRFRTGCFVNLIISTLVFLVFLPEFPSEPSVLPTDGRNFSPSLRMCRSPASYCIWTQPFVDKK